ncbi:hypothetical protein F5Y17DRAFT_437476 [Xylariaceae sp. FL0594]|nr:hypothetical protein F5Y17DRAFT_437476 [Xylariaceae sp. FL0594]
MRQKVIVEGMEIDVPTSDCCWEFWILYACGCRVTKDACLVRRPKTIRVKRDNHSGSCSRWRCLVRTGSHRLPELCRHCELAQAQSEGAPVR